MRPMGVFLLQVSLLAPTAGSRASQDLHILKISSGPRGVEANGVFTVPEERSRFNRAADREVVVYVQWEGPPGRHHLAGQWRSPSGAASATNAFDYEARDRRFGAYWKLALMADMELGTWSIEATVDGQPAGRYSFEIVDEAASSASKTPASARAILSQSDLYERLARVFVALERASADGRPLDAGAAFITGGSHLMTAFSVVDGADRIAAVFPDSRRETLDGVVAFDRKRDWALLVGGPSGDVALPFASQEQVKIGDRCFTLEAGTAGGRTLVQGTVSGEIAPTRGPRQLLVTFLNGTGIPGSPLLSEYGELIGIVGATTMPGSVSLLELLRYRQQLGGIPVVPVSAVRHRPDAAPQSMAALRGAGELSRAVTLGNHVVNAGFARQIPKDINAGIQDINWRFGAGEKALNAFVSWGPQARLKGILRFRLLDDQNRVVAEAKPSKIDLRAGMRVISHLEMPMPAAGVYRAEVLIDDAPAWREFVTIVP